MHDVCETGIVFSCSSVHMRIVAFPSGLHKLCAYLWWDHNSLTFNFHLHSTDIHGSYFNYKYYTTVISTQSLGDTIVAYLNTLQ